MARTRQGQGQTLSGSPSGQFTNFAQKPIQSLRAPTTADTGYELGQLWTDTSTGIIYGLGAVSGGSATWNLMSPGASDVDTLTGDSGGALSPAAGNITLAGGTNITTVGSGSTITFNLDATVVLATSMSSPIYTVAAATDLNINSVTGQDIIMKMGDNAGANKVSFTDSDDAEVFAIDSNGGIGTLTSLTVAGAFTQTAGVVSISEDNSANAVGIANGTTARAITLGSSAAAHTITIGSATGAASLDLLAGTGNFTLEGATGTTYDFSETGVNTGTFSLAGGTGARIVNIATGGTGVKTVNLATGAIGNIVTIGTVTAAASLDLLVGTGNFTLEGDIATTYDISSTGVNTGTVRVASGTGARVVEIAGGGTGVKTINIGAAASADLITIGDATGAGSLDLVCGTGNFTLEGATGSTYDMSATGVNTGTFTIAAGTGARIVNLATGGTGAKTVNIATGAIGNIVTIGTVTAAASLDLLCGTGNFTLEGATGSTYDMSATGVNTGTFTIAAGTGARIVNLATGGTGVKTVNIATGAIGNIVTIGTVTAAASLDLLCGTGDFTLEGDVASTYDISSTGVNTGTVTIASGTGARTVEIAGGGTGIKTINIGAAATADVITIGDATGAGSLTLAAGTGEITVTGTVKEISAEFLEASGDEITAFSQSPILQSVLDTGAAPTGATGDVNLMYLQQGVLMEQFIIGAGQTIIAPRMTSVGLECALDQVNTEGVEYNFGAARTNSRHAFTIDTSLAFFFEVKFAIEDMSGAGPFVIGFRKSEANNATLATYTDYAVIGMNAGTSATEIVIMDELNATGQTITNTTDLWGGDLASKTLRVLVDATGAVTYTIDGAAPSVTNAFTFDTTDVVVPFIHLLQNADLSLVSLLSMKVGFTA